MKNIILIIILFGTSVHADLLWMDIASKDDLSSLPHDFVVGTIEKDGTKRAICRFISKHRGVFVGKLADDTCLTATNVIDLEKTTKWSSTFRNAYTLETSNVFQVLLYEEEGDYHWSSFLEVNMETPLFNASEFTLDGTKKLAVEIEKGEVEYTERQLEIIETLIEILSNDPAYICRAVNKTNQESQLMERGLHSGQLYGVFRNGKCHYQYGDKGFRAPDVYTEDFEVLVEAR